MNFKGLLISYYTIVRKELIRVFRIWTQTFLPSVITSVLYFLIFGAFLGSRIGQIEGLPYIAFVVPGLVMLAVVTNAFTNVAMVFFMAKFFSRNIDEILVSPTPPWVIISAFVTTGIIRGTLVGLLVLLISLLFTHVALTNIGVVIVFLLLTGLVFSLAGLINGIYAKNFDGIMIVPTFVLTPLVYLGGVFYSTESLTGIWHTLMYLNPIFYLINGFRYGVTGVSDVALSTSFAVLFGLTVVLAAINLYLLKKGLGLKQ